MRVRRLIWRHPPYFRKGRENKGGAPDAVWRRSSGYAAAGVIVTQMPAYQA
jgi:hypothetical protein